jgi:hypothetical protein
VVIADLFMNDETDVKAEGFFRAWHRREILNDE